MSLRTLQLFVVIDGGKVDRDIVAQVRQIDWRRIRGILAEYSSLEEVSVIIEEKDQTMDSEVWLELYGLLRPQIPDGVRFARRPCCLS